MPFVLLRLLIFILFVQFCSLILDFLFKLYETRANLMKLSMYVWECDFEFTVHNCQLDSPPGRAQVRFGKITSCDLQELF